MKRIYTFGHEQVERNITVGDIIENKQKDIKMTQVTAANQDEAEIIAKQNIDIPIYPREIALMDKSGEFKLDTPDENLGQGKVSKSGEYTVIAKNLIDFINDENIKNISAMKIDVEGNEESVIIPFINNSNRKLLPLIIIIENNNVSWKTDLIKILEEKGYLIKKKTRMNYILELNE